MSPDDAFVRPAPDWVARLIVIDGCNVGRSSCGYTRESVSCAGLLSIVRWLLIRDFECVIFLPVVYNNAQNANTTHVHLLSKLEEIGLVTFTPARTGSGDRRAFINYDDLYLTTMAERHGGSILSGDKFKDIHAHPNYSEFRSVIESRVVDLRFMFLNHDVVHFGDDIFYRAAPELFIQEDVSTRADSISKKIYCSPSDPDFEKVTGRRNQFTAAKRKEAINVCDDLMYELCERSGIRPLRLTSMPAFQKRPREPEYEEVLPNLEEMQLVRDDSVWQPGDAVTAHTLIPPRFHGEEPEQLEEAEVDLIDFSDNPSPISLPPCPVSRPSDPFDLIELQLNSSVDQDKPERLPEHSQFTPLKVPSAPISRPSQWKDYFNERDDLDSSVARYDRTPKPSESSTWSSAEDDVVTAPTVNLQTSTATGFSVNEITSGATSPTGNQDAFDYTNPIVKQQRSIFNGPVVYQRTSGLTAPNVNRNTSGMTYTVGNQKFSMAQRSVVKAPVTWASICKGPSVAGAFVRVPSLPAPSVPAPSAPVPSVPVPSVTVPSVNEPSVTGSGDGNSPSLPTNEERERVKAQLCRIFPRDVVESVMAMNASCNPDFLAEQCLLVA